MTLRQFIDRYMKFSQQISIIKMNVNYSIADIKKSSYHNLINEGKANDFL
jgi:hypothetical protein